MRSIKALRLPWAVDARQNQKPRPPMAAKTA